VKVLSVTLIIPFGIFGSSHWTTTVLELTGRARTFWAGLPGSQDKNTIRYPWRSWVPPNYSHSQHVYSLYTLYAWASGGGGNGSIFTP